MLKCKRENRNVHTMRIIIDGTRPSCRTQVPDRLKEAVMEASRVAFPGVSPLEYRGRRSCREFSEMCSAQATETLLFVSMYGKFPSWLHKCNGRVIRAAFVASLGFVSAPSGYSWLRRHLMNLSFHMLRRRTELYIAADAATKEDIHRYYFIPKEKIGVAGDPAALALFLRSAVDKSE